jgi:hypothetical protein
MDESRHYSDGVRNEVYQLQSVVVQKAVEEVSRQEVEAALEEGTEDDLLLDVLARELFPSGDPSLHLRLRPEQPRSTSAWILASVIVDWTHTACGTGMQDASAAISLLGFAVDLMWQRVLMRMRWRSMAWSGGASTSLAGGGEWARGCGSTAVARSL